MLKSIDLIMKSYFYSQNQNIISIRHALIPCIIKIRKNMAHVYKGLMFQLLVGSINILKRFIILKVLSLISIFEKKGGK